VRFPDGTTGNVQYFGVYCASDGRNCAGVSAGGNYYALHETVKI